MNKKTRLEIRIFRDGEDEHPRLCASFVFPRKNGAGYQSYEVDSYSLGEITAIGVFGFVTRWKNEASEIGMDVVFADDVRHLIDQYFSGSIDPIKTDKNGVLFFEQTYRDLKVVWSLGKTGWRAEETFSLGDKYPPVLVNFASGHAYPTEEDITLVQEYLAEKFDKILKGEQDGAV